MAKWTPDLDLADIRWTARKEWTGKVGQREVSVSTISRFAAMASVDIEAVSVSGLPEGTYSLLASLNEARTTLEAAKYEEKQALHAICQTLQKEGLALSDIACIVGLTRQRVHQITQNENSNSCILANH